MKFSCILFPFYFENFEKAERKFFSFIPIDTYHFGLSEENEENELSLLGGAR
jgi:hypothetical protein